MASNDFLPLATAGGANVVSQATYAGLAALLANGYQTGIANSAQLNKTFRQSSIMSAVLAQMIADVTGANSVDDGTTATLLANLKKAIGGTPSALPASITLPSGWIVKIGTATTSGAGTATVTYGVAFPTAAIASYAQSSSATPFNGCIATNLTSASQLAISATTAVAGSIPVAGAVTVYWLAIGY